MQYHYTLSLYSILVILTEEYNNYLTQNNESKTLKMLAFAVKIVYSILILHSKYLSDSNN